MKRRTHYIAAHTDSELIIGCIHEHNTVTSATACISAAGGYVIAVQRGKYRTLTDVEEAEFQQAMYGHQELIKCDAPNFALLVRVRYKPN
jgi:hypothetical protein